MKIEFTLRAYNSKIKDLKVEYDSNTQVMNLLN